MREKDRPSAFYAFPSRPDHLVETIEFAIRDINETQVCEVVSWQTLKPTGKLVINTILKQIDAADLFIADLSGLNPNVLFELGYAVGRNKRVWLTVDRTDPANIDTLDTLTTISDLGYVRHENYEDIRDAFLNEYPYDDVSTTLLADYEGMVDGLKTTQSTNDVFHLSSAIDTTAAKQLSRYLSQYGIKVVADDPLENSYEPLEWYISNILDSRTVIAHLQNNKRNNHTTNNGKYSFLAGLARGLNRSVIMIAPEPFEVPFDYRGLLEVYRTGDQCVKKVKKWLEPKLIVRETIDRATADDADDPATKLIRFHIGESTAENEEANLSEYFLETGYFNHGTDTKMAVFIGRKGTGKTANLYQIRRHFQGESHNLVITVKPVSFRLESFVRLVSEIFSEREVMADFVERIWRIVIYADVASELARQLEQRPSYYDYSDAEQALIESVKKEREFIDADFGDKMEVVLELAKNAQEQGKSPKSILGDISRQYAEPFLNAFRKILKKFHKLVVLVDNLDKAWDVHRDVQYQSQIIFGLLGFQNTMRRDLMWIEGDIRMLIFLREDIFAYVLANAREPDKIRLSTTRILWEDTNQLGRLIEARFVASSPSLSRETVWSELFCPIVGHDTTRQFLLEHIMPRPRDLIHVVKTAIMHCVNRGNKRIEAEDLHDALKSYFNFLLDNLVTEYGLYFKNLKKIILQFVGKPEQHSARSLKRILKPVLQKPTEFKPAVEFLMSVSFLGVRSHGSSLFAFSNDDAEKILVMARPAFRFFPPMKLHFVVHPAFHYGLRTSSRSKST